MDLTQLFRNIRDAVHLINSNCFTFTFIKYFQPRKKEENSYFWMNEQTNERSEFVLLSYNPT